MQDGWLVRWKELDETAGFWDTPRLLASGGRLLAWHRER
jgi:hypothetical protein